ncbi:MAG: hypothetical protein MJZ99_07135 [Bacteroidales bacterium]|nr:hypothetical protein [Bacteroidales bacterium]
MPAIIATLVCYLTNPFVVLMADEQGELHGFWHLWQTWDDSLDSAYYMREVVPKWLDYDYDKHYTTYNDTDTWTALYGKTRQFSLLRPDVQWTTKERVQRYFCRVLWLYRNNAYGFLLYGLGADLTHIKWHINEQDHFFGSVGSWLTEPFVYKDERRICSWLKAKVYIGWKSYPGNTEPQRCMLAYRILVDFERGE